MSIFKRLKNIVSSNWDRPNQNAADGANLYTGFPDLDEEIEAILHPTDTPSNDTIIEVNADELDLSINEAEQDIERERQVISPAVWEDFSVTSFDQIRLANTAQKKFYRYFKAMVSDFRFVNIEGNNNYAFLACYEFIKEYETHSDLGKLKEQFNLLKFICPAVKNLTLNYIKVELESIIKKNTPEAETPIQLFKESKEHDYGYENNYDPEIYKLGNKLSKKLELNAEEIKWLNKFFGPYNNFITIEGCCIATAKLYVKAMKALQQTLHANNAMAFEQEMDYFIDKLYAEHPYYDFHSAYELVNVTANFYLLFFKRTESVVRELYGNKRKLVNDFPSKNEAFTREFESRLGELFGSILNQLRATVEKPDVATQIKLNQQHVNRWKSELDDLKQSYTKETESNFTDGINHLEIVNQGNKNLKNIFFEAAKFMASCNKVQALKYYATYINYDLLSPKTDNKPLPKTTLKRLFKDKEEELSFERIIEELTRAKDIAMAHSKISEFYRPKRKKIQLSKTQIETVEQKHKGTVELLNEYLDTENTNQEQEAIHAENSDSSTTLSKPRPDKPRPDKPMQAPVEQIDSVLMADIELNEVQNELIRRIVANAYEMSQAEVEKFAIAHGLFKNQLIDGINAACESYLDGEVLIEEEAENYRIEESYYSEIAK